MARFLLIHGSCHGAWCWRDVLPFLNTGGHSARAIDLPSHGADRTPIDAVTLDSYADAILAAIDEPVVLVGHSMAGYPISAAAERAPEKIAKLIYVCAYAPVNGLSLADMRRAGPRQPLLDAIVTAPDRLSFTIDPAKVEEKFYHDCPEGTVTFAQANLCPQAILPQATPIRLSDRYASVEKHYILCEDDQTIPPEYQATMTSGWPAGTVTTMATSHSPFFATPAILAERLIRIAQ
jgi:pimeloyl-ACP methyl ester carboxylesterase